MLRQVEARNEASPQVLRDARAVPATSPTSIEAWFSVQGGAVNASSEAAQLDLLLAGAELAARFGCKRVWLESMHGLAQPSDSLRLAVSVAGQIESVRVVAAGIRVAALPSSESHDSSDSSDWARSWIRLAEDAATADGICGGRLELAFASAVGPAPHATSKSLEALAELASLLRGVWSGAPFAPNDGSAPIEIHPRPTRREGPKLWAQIDSIDAALAAAHAELSAIASEPELAIAHREAAAQYRDTSQESAYLTAGTCDQAAAKPPVVAIRCNVPAGEGAKAAWLASIEDAFVSPLG